MPDRTTNELEFQGTVLTWMNQELSRRHLGLEMATQEPSKLDRRRNDVVVWRDRKGSDAFLTLELKTPTTRITDPALLADACSKAQRWKAPFFAIWNMQTAELYRTPAGTNAATPSDRLNQLGPIPCVQAVEDWLDPECRTQLQRLALDVLDRAYVAAIQTGVELRIDATVFVDRLTRRIEELRSAVVPELATIARRRKKVRLRLREIAAAQGFLGLVQDIPAAIAGQYCYRVVGQILFYFALRRKQPALKEIQLSEDAGLPTAFRPFWDEVRRYDYEALFAEHELDDLIPLPRRAEEIIRAIVEDFRRYDWNTLEDDVLGAIFEHLIPRQEQVLLGQFYTRSIVADVLLSLTVDGECPQVLDPGCGSGTFLLRSYQMLRKSRHLKHGEILPNLWGFDISPFATELSVINLFRQDLSEYDNFPRILCSDFFDRQVGDEVEFPPAQAGGPGKVVLEIPQFDAVVANPPYLRSQHQDDLDPAYKKKLFNSVMMEHGVEALPKTDLFAFFAYHTHSILKAGGRLGFVTSSSWLTADFGYLLQRLLVEKFELIAVVASEAESFFTQVDQNTVLFVARKRDEDETPAEGELIRFVTLKRPLAEVAPEGPQYWKDVVALTDRIEALSTTFEDDDIRAKCSSAKEELAALRSRKAPRNWSLHLRAPAAYWKALEGDLDFVALDEIAEAHLGYKSLQNEFFYLREETIEEYGIEEEYLRPIFRMADLDAGAFKQAPATETQVFLCDRPEREIRGSGAYRYISVMRDRPATKRKQASDVKTIRKALGDQGGTLWYAPKAVPHSASVWLRKAFDGTYAPFIFAHPQVVDQRCNYVQPRQGVTWKELAALFSSSIFALLLESEGAASLGAGALELATTNLRRLRLPDVRQLGEEARADLVRRAEDLWEHGRPMNWTEPSRLPSPQLRQLDDFLLDACGIDLTTEQLYAAIRETLSARKLLAADKAAAQKAVERADIRSVADGVVKGLEKLIEAVHFPDDFIPPETSVETLELDPKSTFEVELQPFLGTTEITIRKTAGTEVFDATLDDAVAEVVVRALLYGRRKVKYPTDTEVAQRIRDEFWGWITPILEQLAEACSSSSLGSRFEGDILEEARRILGWSPLVGYRDLPASLVLTPDQSDEP